MKRWLGRAAVAVGALYLALCGLFWVIQDDFFFFPAARPLAACPLPAGVKFVEFEGERALFTQARGEGLLIFYHGNAGSACGWRFLGPNHVRAFGYDTLVVEFPGYAGDAREPSGPAFASMVERVGRWAAKYDRVVVSGFSLGSGVASLHAAQSPPDAVLLFAPFADFKELVRSKGGWFPGFLFRTEFDNSALLRKSGAPVTIVVGDQDEIIPPEVSLGLADDLTVDPADIVIVPGAGHNDLIGAVNLYDVLDRVLR